MLPVTHLLAPIVGLLLYSRYRDIEVRRQDILAAALGGILPDLLNLHIALAERASWSHSLLILPVLAAAVLLLPQRYRRHGTIFASGTGIHIALDILSAPYNFLYPLPFSPAYPRLGHCGLEWWICWYAMDILLTVLVLALLLDYEEIP